MTPGKTHAWIKDPQDDPVQSHSCSKCGIVKMFVDVWMWAYFEDDEWRGPINQKHLLDMDGETMPTCSEVSMQEALG